MKICEMPTPDFRSTREHSYYQDHLVKTAIDDGATHVTTLHVDSFPISPGWAKNLADKLTGTCVLAAVTLEKYSGPYTACLFFRRDFYVQHNPVFFLAETIRTTPKYHQFSKEYPHNLHSGTGYLFKAYMEGLTWYPMMRTDKGEKASLASIHGDMIFHLGGAVRYGSEPIKSIGLLERRNFVSFAFKVLRAFKPFIPKFIKKRYQDRIDQTAGRQRLKHARNQLLENPESLMNDTSNHVTEG
jgi:hypothetical protein